MALPYIDRNEVEIFTFGGPKEEDFVRINNNTSALNTFGQLSKNDKNVQTSFAKLSSGLRITKAADDAAGVTDLF
jgi:hypothetical protein